MKICLVVSTGGHLVQLTNLESMWKEHERFWVTFSKEDAKALLEKERVIWAHHPTNRNLLNLFRNLILAWNVLRKEKPDAIVSTGAGVAVPFFWIGKILGIRTVFIESLTRIHDLSLTGKLIYPFASRFFVQWPELGARYSKAIYAGNTLGEEG